MTKKKYLKFGLVPASLLAVGVFVVGMFLYTIQKENIAKLASLNSKYGLVAAEPLNSASNSEEIAFLFSTDVIQANVLNSSAPRKELVLKINGQGGNKALLSNIFILKLRTNASIEDISKNYEALDLVAYAEPNYTFELAGFSPQTSAKKIVATSSQNKSDRNIIVAVADSGIDTKHKDLIGKTVEGWDFTKDKKIVTDSFGHGTHIAGIITKNSNSAKVMPLKITNGNEGKMSDVAKAINYAADNGAKVINLSLGLQERSKLLQDAIDYAEKKDVIVVAAAGNYNTDQKFYPAAYSGVVAVTALSNKDEKLYQSNYGTWVDYSVKAQDVYSTLPNNTYGYKTGTSQAASFVSAKIADILNSEKTPDLKTVSSDLEKSSTPITKGKYKGLLGRELTVD